jgi:hypothetical protein
VAYRAPSWQSLVAQARPDATFKRSLFLWCKDLGQGSWLFDLAEVFEVHEKKSTTWAVIGEPERWMGSDMEGQFMTGRATYPEIRPSDGDVGRAELVGRSAGWGQVYKISCPSVPGGAHANTCRCVVLASHRLDGSWEMLCRDTECDSWRMGSYRVSEHLSFDLLACKKGSPFPFQVRVEGTYAEGPALEGDERESWDIHRVGSLIGPTPMNVQWSSAWRYQVRAGETWESIAGRLLAFRDLSVQDAAKAVLDFKRSNPVVAPRQPRRGENLSVPSSIHRDP